VNPGLYSESQEITNIIEVIISVKEATQYFTYVAIMDERACDVCLGYDKGLMTPNEAEDRFDYLEKWTYGVWKPNVHPSCRCFLYRNEDEELEPAKPKQEPKPELEPTIEPVKKPGHNEAGYPTVTPTQFNKVLTDAERTLQRVKDGEDDDDELWVLVALGLLDKVKKRKEELKK
jgi:hypothetical protein